MEDFQYDYMISLLPKILQYLFVTIKIAIISLFIALILGLLLAIIKDCDIKVIRLFCNLYVSFFRSTPFIAQLFFFYYGVAQFIPVLINIPAETALILILSMNSSAYMSEIIRGALSSVDKGQKEAALSIGMTDWESMKRIVIPQGARVAVPGLSNCFIDLIKGSAVGFTIGVTEMMSKAQIEAATSFRYLEVYMATIIIYWGVVTFFTFFQKKLEKSMNKAY